MPGCPFSRVASSFELLGHRLRDWGHWSCFCCTQRLSQVRVSGHGQKRHHEPLATRLTTTSLIQDKIGPLAAHQWQTLSPAEPCG